MVSAKSVCYLMFFLCGVGPRVLKLEQRFMNSFAVVVLGFIRKSVESMPFRLQTCV